MTPDVFVWVYCVHCHMPCQAACRDHKIEWFVTCDCAWQHSPCMDTSTLHTMEERARTERILILKH